MVAIFVATFTSCSSFMLAVLSVDGYLALRRDAGGMRNAFTVSVVVWLLAGTLSCIIPYVRVQQLVKFDCSDLEIAYCVEKWPHGIDLQAYRCVRHTCLRACVRACARVFARAVGAVRPFCGYGCGWCRVCVCVCVRACAHVGACVLWHIVSYTVHIVHTVHTVKILLCYKLHIFPCPMLNATRQR